MREEMELTNGKDFYLTPVREKEIFKLLIQKSASPSYFQINDAMKSKNEKGNAISPFESRVINY